MTLFEIVIWTLAFGLNARVAIWTYHWNNRRRERKFLCHLKIEHPDSTITLTSVASSDWDALNKIKEQLDVLS